MATVTFNIPDPLLARLAAAIRGDAPATTDDLTTVKTYVRFMIRSLLSGAEAQAVRKNQANAATVAEQKAWSDTEVIG